MFYVTVCPRCGQYLLARETQRTRECTYCGAHVVLANSERVASAKTARDAYELIRELKLRHKNSATR